MKILLIVASLGVLASAAPQQSSQYAAPAGYDAASLGNIDVSQLLSSLRSQLQSAPQSSYAAPSGNEGRPQAARPVAAFSSSSYSAPSGSSAEQSYGAPQPDSGYGGPEEPQKVHKHVFVHIAPSEVPTQKAIKPYKAPPKPEKHYKILFIKAPTPPPYEYPEVPDLPVLPEQKTLVYVLLKSADPTQEITLPTYASTKPSKPEVYFIRYKNPEAEKPNDEYGPPSEGGNATPSPGYQK